MNQATGTSNLEQRLAALEDYQDIIQLKSLYIHAMDETSSGAGVPQQFDLTNRLLERMTADCKAEYVGLFEVKGRTALAEYYKKTIPAGVPFSSHLISNPFLTIEGDRARGLWSFLVCVTLKDQAHWGQGTYEDAYLKEQDIWKIASYKVRFNFLSPFDQGWVKTRMVSF